ncbi:hypothetical protein IQ273_18190 [Nodosilinea sp. LEGE 07298]|uniref:hypothetical protein n=1 Tax=Nodosilinea sp. LEGE 07298 TaxID=2777970 RepID=UPI0018830222|nr:hypothetical protein [Nodosilinea sp. LEGE 07298]MBE9111339.1 hypothetical protein [Nodosilinea sp. LEGE 07298]
MAIADNFFLVGNTRGNNVTLFDFSSGELLGDFISAESGLLDDPDTLLFGPDANGDRLKDLYITNGTKPGTSSVLRFDGTTGAFIDAFISDDPTTDIDETGGLVRPYELAFGPDGNLYVASFLSDQILRYDGKTGAFLDIFAEGNGLAGGLNGPDGLLFINESLYVTTQGSIATEDSDTGDIFPSFSAGLPSQILRYDTLAPGTTPTIFATPDPSSESFGFVSLLGLEVGPVDGDLYVSDFAGDILRFDVETGDLIERLSTNFTTGESPSNNFIGNLDFSSTGNLLTVGFDVSTEEGAVLLFGENDGTPKSPFDVLVPITPLLNRPIGVTFLDNTPEIIEAPILELVDLTGFDGDVTVNVTASREASFSNILKFYETDARGFVAGLLPGEAGYEDAVATNLLDVQLFVANNTTANIDFNLPGGVFYAPALLINGSSTNLATIDDAALGNVRVKREGNTWSFEDLTDNDFNDLVVTINSVNPVVSSAD